MADPMMEERYPLPIATITPADWQATPESVQRLVHALLNRAESAVLPQHQAESGQETFYCELVQTQTDFVLRSQPDTTITFANDALCQALGCSLEQVLGQKWIDFADPDDLQTILQQLQQLTPEQPRFLAENRDRRANGQEGWTQWINQGVFDGQGQLVAIQSVGRDITALKQTEAALRASEARLRTIATNIPGAIFRYLLRSDGTDAVLYMSPGCYKLWEIEAADVEASAERLWAMIHPQDLPAMYHSVMVSAQEMTPWSWEWRIVTPSGQLKWLRAAAEAPTRSINGDLIWDTLILDITEQQQLLRDRDRVEAALKASEEQLRLAFDFTQTGSWDWDLLTNRLTWNRNHFQLLGLDPDQAEASYDLWRDRLHPDDLATVEATFRTALKTKTPYRAEYRTVHPDGTVRWLVGKGQAVYDAKGHPVRVIGTILDITERKRSEERIELMAAIAQRIRQSLNLNDILNTTVMEVNQLLQVDRVVVYQFAPDMSGVIVAESVTAGWPALLGTPINDPCFQTDMGGDYRQGKRRAIADIYTAGLAECHLQLLQQFQVRANLIVPILLMNEVPHPQLWGLLIAHHCEGPREWQPTQLEWLDQIAVQLAIAIQQAQTLEQARQELAERQQAETHLRTALAEKEVLLKEIHHRVKNNLQIVSGLLQLQAQGLTNPQIVNALQESQSRIESMSLIHKKLYTSSDLGAIDVADYIQSLAVSLLTTYQISPGTIALQVDVEPVVLSLDQAIPCGLIINELVSNALKYAFPGQRSGEIQIGLRQVDGNLELTIKDNGIGLPDDLDWQEAQSLGLSLVSALATDQLDGSFTVQRDQGTVFTVKFPYVVYL